MRRLLLAPPLTTLVLLPLLARPALAHGFGARYDLPVPLWLYLFGSAAAVVLSFVVVGLLAGGDGGGGRSYPRFDLLRVVPFRAVFASRPFLLGVRLLSAALFVLVVAAGLFGERYPTENFAPTFVWIVWWVGLAFACAFVGNLWELVNPWKILFGWADGLARRLGAEKGLALNEPYPASWGVWPAAALYLGFAWVELVFWGSYDPFYLAALVLLYSGITFCGMVLFGEETWLRRGEAFSVFFGLLSRFAPTEVRVKEPAACRDRAACAGSTEGECVNCYGCFERAAPENRELNLRPPAVGLSRPERVPAGGVAFVVLVLASVTFDGLLETPLWGAFRELLPGFAAVETLGLVVAPLAFGALYLLFVWLSGLFGGGGPALGSLAAGYVFSLVPIAIAYHAAHYLTYLLVQGQTIFGLVSDPFGFGWDLFGTAGYEPDPGVVGAGLVWYSQVGLIVAGHVVAVYLAHLVSLRYFDSPRSALRSQYPVLALMTFYTVFSLWILSQPIVEQGATGFRAS
jgi:hypothetical protein